MTKKQKLFIDEYLIDLNATQAAIRAGYSPKTAKSIGSENLTKPDIETAISKKMAERSRRTGINQERVLNEIAKIAFMNIDDIVDLKNASVKENADREDLACIQAVEVKPGEFGIERKVKLYDKKAALELLGRHLGMFKDKVEVSAIEQEKSKLDELLSQIGGG